MPKKPKPIAMEHTSHPGCSDLLEITLFAPQGANEHDFHLGADVRFGTMLISSDDWAKSIEVGLSRAVLALDFIGCAADPASARYGDRKPVPVSTHVLRTNDLNQTTQGGMRGTLKGNLRPTNVSGAIESSVQVGHSRAQKTAITETQKLSIHENPVIALAGNRWRFSAVASEHMESRYAGDDTLCKVVIKSLPMRIEGRLSFTPRDIVIVDGEAPGVWDRFRSSPNKTAIAKVLLAKHLRNLNPLNDKTDPGAALVGSISMLRGDHPDEE